jgi:heme exporter protein B
VSPFLAIIKRDLLLAVRQGGGLGPALGFILAVLVMVPLSVGPDQALLQRLAPGIMWLTLLLAVLLTADRIFNQDLDDGSLEVMTMQRLPLEGVTFAKAIAHWLSVCLPLAILAPFLGFLLNLDVSVLGLLLVSMVAGSLALSMLAAIGGAVTSGLRRGGLLITLLVLPLYVPVMIFGISVTASMMGPGRSLPSLLVLLAITLAAAVISPWASAAALRVYLK